MVDVYTHQSVTRAITEAVRKTYQIQRGYCEYEDLQAEAWMWVVGHEEQIVERLDDESGKAKAWVFGRVRSALHKYVMRQRYLKDGTRPGDYHFYTEAQVADMLPDALDGHGRSGQSADLNAGRSMRAPNEGWEYEATIADIQAGLASLPESDRLLLVDKYADGGTSDEVLAIKHDVTDRTVRNRVNSALRKIVNHLGGPSNSRRRRSLSNAASSVAVRRQESGA